MIVKIVVNPKTMHVIIGLVTAAAVYGLCVRNRNRKQEEENNAA